MPRHEAEQFFLPGVLDADRSPAQPPRAPGFSDRVDYSLEAARRLLNGEPQMDFDSFALLRSVRPDFGRPRPPAFREKLRYAAVQAAGLLRGHAPEPFHVYRVRARFNETLSALRVRMGALQSSVSEAAGAPRHAQPPPELFPAPPSQIDTQSGSGFPSERGAPRWSGSASSPLVR